MSYEEAWAAGLFEGEGCFSMQRRNGKKSKASPRHVLLSATVSMTDEDVLRRFAAAVGMGRVTGPRQHASAHKPVWYWSVSGAQVARLYALLEPGLGERRRARYAALLEERREYERSTLRNGRPRIAKQPLEVA